MWPGLGLNILTVTARSFRSPTTKFSSSMISAFLLSFEANYLEKNTWLPPFLCVDSNSLCKHLLFPHGPNPLYLVGTVQTS